MKAIPIEFSVKSGDGEFNEESVSFQTPAELFEYVAPGGGCEAMPDDVCEIQMVFRPPEHPNSQNPIADLRVTLELGMVFLTGPLSEIAETADAIMNKAGRGELSQSFLAVIGAGNI